MFICAEGGTALGIAIVAIGVSVIRFVAVGAGIVSVKVGEGVDVSVDWFDACALAGDSNVAVTGGGKIIGVGVFGKAVGVRNGVGGKLYGTDSAHPEHPHREIANATQKRESFIAGSFDGFDYYRFLNTRQDPAGEFVVLRFFSGKTVFRASLRYISEFSRYPGLAVNCGGAEFICIACPQNSHLTNALKFPILFLLTRVSKVVPGMPPAKRSTSRDVAKLAGVSRTTVSFVLNQNEGVSISKATRQRVLKAAKRLNYHPNAAGRKLVSGKSDTLGLVLHQSPEQVFADAFLPRVILGVEQAAMQLGFHVLLKQVDPKDKNGYARLIHENHVDGIILSGPRQDDEDIVRLHREGVPVMLLGQLPDSHLPFVDVDARRGAETAVKHLVELGHKRIAMITNAPLSYTSSQQRRDGYLQALRNSRLKVDSALIKEGNYTPASGYQAMTELLNLSPRPTAVFIASDVVALGAILAIHRAGLQLPDDIAMVGFDDIPLAEYFDPPLTTVRLPAFGLGLAAAERVIQLIQGKALDSNEVLMETELVVRESTVGSSVPV